MSAVRTGPYCPDCGYQLQRRTSEMQHSCLQSIYFRCTSAICGASFYGYLCITHRINMPLNPNPDVDLPISSAKINREVAQAEARVLKKKRGS